MEAEVGELTGAAKGGRAPDRRLTNRNGYRERRWDTRVGTIGLSIPKVRDGSYFPSLLEPRRRAERAPWGSETAIRSRRGAVVLMDEAAEQVPAANVARTDRHGDPRHAEWRGEADGAMGSPALVVFDIGPERPIEMPSTEDERP